MHKMKWGVIGCGGIADRKTIPAMMLSDKIELVAVMDSNIDIAVNIKNKYNIKSAFSSYEELLSLDEIEAVYIASPVFCHLEHSIAAAKAKKHILLEKPMALTVSDAQKIKKVCDDMEVKLGVGFHMRFHVYHQKIKEIIEEGKIGEVVSMRSQYTCWYPEIEGAWRQNIKLSGGGVLMDMGIHCIDILHYITGLHAKEVMSFNQTNTFSYSVEDTSGVLMKMNNGAVAYVDSNFNVPDEAIISKLEIYCTNGTIFASRTLGQAEVGKLNVLIAGKALAYDPNQNRKKITQQAFDDLEIGANIYKTEIEAFIEAILTDKEVPVTAESAIYTQKVVEAAYKSTKSKKAVKVK